MRLIGRIAKIKMKFVSALIVSGGETFFLWHKNIEDLRDMKPGVWVEFTPGDTVEAPKHRMAYDVKRIEESKEAA